jgi:phosphoribosylformylglycinamidine cyclo-ligase
MRKIQKPSATYAGSGVDIEKGERFVNMIKSFKSKAVPLNLGGFSGGIELDLKRFTKPLLFSTTDGVGTKILVAKKLKDFSSIGIDLVAMCVNDLIVCGAEPIVFLDYIACGKLDLGIMHTVMHGIVNGCEQAECTLAGGETAEMPDVYGEHDFDLAGFAMGVVDKPAVLPKKDKLEAGDIILGLASSGIHSNGLSLARKVINQHDISVWKKLLTPTKIYVHEMKLLLHSGLILAAAHITGGGLAGNISRVIPDNLVLSLNYTWHVPDIFSHIKHCGNISNQEMYKVFNMGIGMAIIVKKNKADALLSLAAKHKIKLDIIGCVDNG